MTKSDARKQLADNLMMLAEALLDDEAAGQYTSNEFEGRLKITSKHPTGTTIVAVTNWNYSKCEEEDEWDEYIYDNTKR